MDIEDQPRTGESALSIGLAMLLIAGATVGIWLALGELRSRNMGNGPDDHIAKVIFVFVFVLGGVSLVGVPLLLRTARHRPWGAGRLLWFAQGTAAWLLWPPIVYQRVQGRTAGSISAICYFYGTPLMALYMTLALFGWGLSASLPHAAESSVRGKRPSAFCSAWHGPARGSTCSRSFIVKTFLGSDFRRRT